MQKRNAVRHFLRSGLLSCLMAFAMSFPVFPEEDEIEVEFAPPEIFFRYCGEEKLVPTAIIARLETDGWIRLPLAETNKFFTGVLPAERISYQHPDVAEPFVVSVAVAGLTGQEQRRMLRAGLEVETSRIDTERVYENSSTQPEKALIGYSICQISGFSLRAARMPWLVEGFLNLERTGELEHFNSFAFDFAGERFSLNNYLVLADNNWGYLNVASSMTYSGNWDGFYFFINRSSAIYRADDPQTYAFPE